MSKISGSGTPTSNGARPQLNGKVERSHRSDQQEFYQLLSYKGDVDLEAKLDEWERFYNFARPHGAHNGQTPYEALRDKLQSQRKCPAGSSRLHHQPNFLKAKY